MKDVGNHKVKVGGETYESKVVVDDECEIMSDHTTGCHLQGMLILEAARQMFLAVTEKYFVDNKKDYYFVINRMGASYASFSFPIPMRVIFRTASLDYGKNGTIKAKAKISFVQQGVNTTEVEVEYTALERSRLEVKEIELARKAIIGEISAGGS